MRARRGVVDTQPRLGVDVVHAQQAREVVSRGHVVPALPQRYGFSGDPQPVGDHLLAQADGARGAQKSSEHRIALTVDAPSVLRILHAIFSC